MHGMRERMQRFGRRDDGVVGGVGGLVMILDDSARELAEAGIVVRIPVRCPRVRIEVVIALSS